MTPISTRRTFDSSGFTLIELLVTLVIMGMLAGLASLAVGGSAHRQAQEEAERFYQMLGFASEEATLAGEEFGILVEEDRYSFLRFDPGEEQWLPNAPREFAPHELPPTVRMELSIEDAPALASARRGDAQRAPEVLVLSSGEISSFRMQFLSSDGPEPVASIASDGSGNLVWE